MIAFLSGNIHSVHNRSVILLAAGVGYRVQLAASDLTKIKSGEPAALFIHTHVREDALELFGFISEDNLGLFELLISVSGIGPKLALGVLSGMNAQQFKVAVTSNNLTALTHISGVGKKTAERMVLELKDKLGQISGSAMLLHTPAFTKAEELRSALTNLGYRPNALEKALKSVEPLVKQGEPLEKLLKEALRSLGPQ